MKSHKRLSGLGVRISNSYKGINPPSYDNINVNEELRTLLSVCFRIY